MDAYQLASKYLYPFKIAKQQDGTDVIKSKKCPFCKRSDYGFYISLKTNRYDCFHENNCHESGTLDDLESYLLATQTPNDNFEVKESQKVHTKLDITLDDLSQESIEYLELRKITKVTAESIGLKEIIKNKVKCIAFPYYDEEGDVCFCKYRPIGKHKKGSAKYFVEANGTPTLWRFNDLDLKQPIIITEGELDAAAIYQSGYSNVTSIPLGAGTGNKQRWIVDNWEKLNTVSMFILALDNDEAGDSTVKELMRRLGEDKCRTVRWTHKDANEELFLEGEESLKRVIEEAKDVPYAGVIDLSTVRNKTQEGFYTGLYSLDRFTQKPKFSDVTILTGKTGNGKSTLLSTISLSAISQNIPVFMFSGELSKERLQGWINSVAAGSKNMTNFINEWGDAQYQVKDDINDKICEWYRNKLFVYDNSISKGVQDSNKVLEAAKYCIKRYGVKLIIIDNMMTCDIKSKDNDSLFQAQTNFMLDCSVLAKSMGVHVIVVAHPRKTANDEAVEVNSVSGSANLGNLAENVWVFDRNKDELTLTIKKNRDTGRINDKILLHYNFEDRRITEIDKTGKPKAWMRLGWEV